MKIPRYSLTLRRSGILNVAERKVDNDYVAASVLWHELRDEPFEVVVAFGLNAGNEIIGMTRLGTLSAVSSASVDVRAIFKFALLTNASAIILGHNHPSGRENPSPEDRELTKAVYRVGQTLGLPLLDHIIVAPDLTSETRRHHHFSFVNEIQSWRTSANAV